MESIKWVHLLGSVGCERCRQLRASGNLENQWRASIGIGIRAESLAVTKNEFDCGRCERCRGTNPVNGDDTIVLACGFTASLYFVCRLCWSEYEC